jgi:hypothetical protein
MARPAPSYSLASPTPGYPCSSERSGDMALNATAARRHLPPPMNATQRVCKIEQQGENLTRSRFGI